ncbi:hypothetical protein GLOIN_2v1718912 [Rhizophagus clarus]|nr:hypothetical protein GLOIN_2v1718912 [Rhizophagus clarus]
MLHHQFESSPVKDTNSVLRDTSCSLQCTNMEYFKILPLLQVNTGTIQNNTPSRLKVLSLEREAKDKVSHEGNDHEELTFNDCNSLRKSVDDQTFEEAVAELKEIISNSRYLSYVFPIGIERRVITTSPILRAPNPIPSNKPFMNNNYEKMAHFLPRSDSEYEYYDI